MQMHADVADENATLRDKVAMLEARDRSRTVIEDLYSQLVASGILDVDEEEEEGVANEINEGDMEVSAKEDSASDAASAPHSEAQDPGDGLEPAVDGEMNE